MAIESARSSTQAIPQQREDPTVFYEDVLWWPAHLQSHSSSVRSVKLTRSQWCPLILTVWPQMKNSNIFNLSMDEQLNLTRPLANVSSVFFNVVQSIALFWPFTWVLCTYVLVSQRSCVTVQAEMKSSKIRGTNPLLFSHRDLCAIFRYGSAGPDIGSQ